MTYLSHIPDSQNPFLPQNNSEYAEQPELNDNGFDQHQSFLRSEEYAAHPGNPFAPGPIPIGNEGMERPFNFHVGFNGTDIQTMPLQNVYFPYPLEGEFLQRNLEIPMPRDGTFEESGWIEKSWNLRQLADATQAANYAEKPIDFVNGIYSVDLPVSSFIKQRFSEGILDLEPGSNEFSHLRYTACTCDPDEFVAKNYTLRAAKGETELLIAVTYYSEDKILTARTLQGIMQNVQSFCKGKSEFWNAGSRDVAPWQKIVVTLVMDGLKHCRKEVLDVLATMGIYQDGVMKGAVNDDATVAHLFEYTSPICFSSDLEILSTTPGADAHTIIPPIQYIVCLKQENAKKINSHRWVFRAFAPLLKPRVCVLLDAGTKPAKKSIVHLWRAFYNNENVGGACGEIHAMLGKHGRNLLNPIVAAQNFEYKLSNQLDKPLEDTFGFIAVLPGAFSAYRLDAIQDRPLEQYFRGDHSLADKLGSRGLNAMNIFKRNMFLAEDRILCFETTFKMDKKYHLQYVKAAKAETDVPESVDEFIVQRRRWINGSFAATLYSMMHFSQLYKTAHSPVRNIFMHLQLFYNFVIILVTWFSLSLYYLSTTIILQMAADPVGMKTTCDDVEGTIGKRVVAKGVGMLLRRQTSNTTRSFPFKSVSLSLSIALVTRFTYLLMILVSLILALGNKPKTAKKHFIFLFIVFGIIQFYTVIVAIYLSIVAFTDPYKGVDVCRTLFSTIDPRALVSLALASTFGLYIYAGTVYLDAWHLFHSFVQYTFIMPSFINVINIFAFCNWHDVTWGTKGADKSDILPAAKSEKLKDGETEVVVTHEKDQQHIDTYFAAAVERAKRPYAKTFKGGDSETDSKVVKAASKLFRTNLVIGWLLCNIILAVALTSKSVTSIGFTGTSDRFEAFFFTLIVITTFLAFCRFIGCTVFVIRNAIIWKYGKR